MEKFCVFCGDKPQNKTKEHIIPQWLIEYTGDPKRDISVGFDMKDKKIRKFSFNKLAFPACYDCNNEFSKLEAEVKPIIIRLLNDNAIKTVDSNILLEWLDKVRIGLWLLFYSLNDNPYDINPHFHIKTRIGRFDRMVIIYKLEGNVPNGINFIGTDTFAFQITPSCFTLRINNYCFFNVSKELLLARRIGFPFAKDYKLQSDESDILDMEIVEGMKRKMLPLIRGAQFLQGIELYQPQVLKDIFYKNGLYDNEYVISHCMDVNNGIGKVFYYDKLNNKLVSDVDIDTYQYFNNKSMWGLYSDILKQTYNFQNKLLDVPKNYFANASKERKEIYLEQAEAARMYNNKMIELMMND